MPTVDNSKVEKLTSPERGNEIYEQNKREGGGGKRLSCWSCGRASMPARVWKARYTPVSTGEEETEGPLVCWWACLVTVCQGETPSLTIGWKVMDKTRCQPLAFQHIFLYTHLSAYTCETTLPHTDHTHTHIHHTTLLTGPEEQMSKEAIKYYSTDINGRRNFKTFMWRE